MGWHRQYRERTYAVAERLLALRTRTRLTQADLAAQVGVHRRSVQKWEAGEAYPTAQALQRLIAIFLAQGVFTPGHELEEIAGFWQQVSQDAPRPLAPFDPDWVTGLLAGRAAASGMIPPACVPKTGLLPGQGVGAGDAVGRADAGHPTRNERHGALNPPFQPTSFVGRSAELSELARLLGDPACRLLTLLGPGGIGKTRLAIEVSGGHVAPFSDGLVFVALASVGSPHQIVSAIGDAIGLSFAGQADPTTHLLGYLRTRQLLLVLDNFEHVLDGADLVSEILAHAPHIKIIVTSRELLNLQAEWLFHVEGLAYPVDVLHPAVEPRLDRDLTDYSAVQLFMQRATQVGAGFPIAKEDMATVARICQQVAGIPLAIELAAAAMRILPVAEIERQIGANLDALVTPRRDVPVRHRSLRAVFDHSWLLLSEVERATFRRLAVFRGGWTAAAAEQVAGATLPDLTRLIDKSLVHVASAQALASALHGPPTVTPEPRFIFLEPIREYALERLADSPDAETTRQRHARYYTVLAESAMARWNTPALDRAVAQLHREHDNLRAALQWACETGHNVIGLQLAAALWAFWRSYGYIGEGRAWLDQLLALNEDPVDPVAMAARRRGLHAAAWLASDQHDFARATRLFEQSMALRRALGEVASETDLLVNAAREARALGHYQRATALLEDVLARHHAGGERTSRGGARLALSFDELGQVLRELGLVVREQGEFARAAALFEEGLTLHRAIGDRGGVAFALLGLADVARDQGDCAGVRQYCEPSLAILRELGIQWAIGFTLNTLALGAYDEHDLPRAMALIRESVAVFRELKADASRAEVLITLGKIAQAQGDAVAAYGALTEALRLASALGPRLMVAAALEGLARVVGAQGHAELAVRLLAVASALRVQMGAPVRPADQAMVDHALATARSMMGADVFAAVWVEAQSLPVEHIINGLPSVAVFTAVRDRSAT